MNHAQQSEMNTKGFRAIQIVWTQSFPTVHYSYCEYKLTLKYSFLKLLVSVWRNFRDTKKLSQKTRQLGKIE